VQPTKEIFRTLKFQAWKVLIKTLVMENLGKVMENGLAVLEFSMASMG